MASKIIDVNADSWRSVLDFYDSVLKSIQAPDWHGQNVNALVDSMVYGGINGVEPPYTLRFHGIDSTPREVLEEVEMVERAVCQARIERQRTTGMDADVGFEFANPSNQLTNG